MSAKGNCHDNACAESFFYGLKVEAIRGQRFQTHDDMRCTVLEYIEIDCNDSASTARTATSARPTKRLGIHLYPCSQSGARSDLVALCRSAAARLAVVDIMNRFINEGYV
jgi:hypothetical protein